MTTTATTTKVSPIRAVMGFDALQNPDLIVLANSVVKGLTGNAAFTTLPIPIATFTNDVNTYSAAASAALDGGKNAKAVRDKERKVVIGDLRQLAVYVENNCNNDMATFTSSGFTAKAKASPTGPVAVPVIKTLDYGNNSGQILVSIKAVAGGRSYNVRYAPVPAGGTPSAWTSMQVGSIRSAVTVSNLTPGTTYAFQVQALGSAGLSDWSDSSTIMCV